MLLQHKLNNYDQFQIKSQELLRNNAQGHRKNTVLEPLSNTTNPMAQTASLKQKVFKDGILSP